MQRGFNLETYIDKKTGFVPAAVFSKNKIMEDYEWLRDAALVFRAVNDETKKLIGKGLETYMYKNQSRTCDFEELDWTDECSYLPPLCNKYFETPLSKWLFHQNDSVGSKLYIASELKKRDIALKLLQYLAFRRFYEDKEGGIWEGDGPAEYPGQELNKRLRASSICACASAIESFEKNFERTSLTKELLEKAYDAAEKILPYECLATETEGAQPCNLALAFALAIDPILPIRENKKLQEQILDNILKLEGEYGFARFPKDRWDGVTHHLVGEIEPMQWIIGNDLVYLHTKDKRFLDKTRKIINEHGYIPEGFVNPETNGEPDWKLNGTHLLEAEAVHVIAERVAA